MINDQAAARLQIIDAAADIYLFKTPEEKSESAHAHIYNNAAEKEPFAVCC